MKKRLLVLALLPLLLVGCGGGSGDSSGDGDKGGSQQTIRYTVKFANTSMQDVEIEEGKTLSKPIDPTKSGSLFVGWYMDAEFKTEVRFPLVINGDTTIYAQFYSYKDAFAKARNNTIGESVPGYEYDYTLHFAATYMGFSLNGNTVGNAKYNAGSDDVTFYDEHTNSGSLMIDGNKYSIKKGNELHEVTVNEEGVIKKYNIKNVGQDYKYDSSSFAKAVFEYDESKLKDIQPTSTKNEYKLKTAFNFSAGLALVGNYINHPMVEKIIGELPETSVDTGMYVTFDGNKLNSYRYEMTIDVSGVTFSLTYDLMFKNIGKAPTINPKAFANTYVTNSDVSRIKSELNDALFAYKQLEHSSYDYKVETEVDFVKKNAINATIDGFTKRKVGSSSVYFLNDYEIDSDLKNADLYKSSGLEDCHGGRVMLSTGEVHDLKKKALGGYSDVKVVDYDHIDDFYLFDILKAVNNPTYIQKITDTKNNTVTYVVGENSDGVKDVLKYFNDNIRINALGECSVDVKPFGQFDENLIAAKEFEFAITFTNGSLTGMELEIDGKINTSYPGSRDFQTNQDGGFKLEFELEITDDGKNYEPASKVSDVK